MLPQKNTVDLTGTSNSELFYDDLPKTEKKSSKLRVDLLPAESERKFTFESLLSLTRLILNQEKYLATQVIKFFEVTGKMDLVHHALDKIDFDCEDIDFEDILKGDLNNSLQYIKLSENDGQSNKIVMGNKRNINFKHTRYLNQITLVLDKSPSYMIQEDFFQLFVEIEFLPYTNDHNSMTRSTTSGGGTTGYGQRCHCVSRLKKGRRF